MEQQWIQVDIITTTEGLEPLGAALSEIGYPAFAVADPDEFKNFLGGQGTRWDYIDDELFALLDAQTMITVYLPDNEQSPDDLTAIRLMLERLKKLDADGEWGSLLYECSNIQEEEWASAWKQYYKPEKVGEHLVICPSWEDYERQEDEIILLMDPGMAFGTGSHETTRLCLQALEEIVRPGNEALDLGCGSGILSIAAILFGAESAVGVDIDETAVRVARENADLNGVSDRAYFLTGDLLEPIESQYDLICANIVADIILRLAPDVPAKLKPRGLFLASGIIDNRAEEVEDAVQDCGLALISREDRGGWVSLLFQKLLF